MNKRVSGSTPFDFPESSQIASSKVAVTMLEFPKCRFWGTGMKNIADCNDHISHSSLQERTRAITYLCGSRTC